MTDIDQQVWGVNHQWARFLFTELIRQGVTTFAVSTGSRNTALMLALAEFDNISLLTHPDERGAAFFALGYGRACGKPAALVCTSGTAAANYYPAIIEASMANIPLIAVTADRPAEVRDARTDQVIDQPNLYSKYLRWSFDFPAPEKDFCADHLLTAVDQAVYRAVSNPAGPVHLNCCLRKPHVTEPEPKRWYQDTPLIETWKKQTTPFTTYLSSPKTLETSALESLAAIISQSQKGMIVCAGLNPQGNARAIQNLGKHLGWPILADITSNVRSGAPAAQAQPIISHFELFLRAPSMAATFRPDMVLHFGGDAVNESVQQFLKNTGAEYVLINDHPFRQDPCRIVSQRIDADPFLVAEQLSNICTPNHSGLLDRFIKADSVCRDILSKEHQANTKHSEWQIIPELIREIQPESGLFLGNSLPVRELDRFAPCIEKRLYVGSNRGVSGIDGNIACAAGFAMGLNKPSTLFTGDVAFIHDINSLLLLKRINLPLTVVIPNNDGGGIFPFLPTVTQAECFEKMFVAPHGLSFEKAAEMFDIPYYAPNSSSSFRDAYREALSLNRSSLIEVRTERTQNVKEQRAIHQQVAQALEKADFLAGC